MQAPELSLILPVRDIEIELPGILRSIKEQVGAAAAEWIIVDMGSEDQTVLRAVQYIKEERLQGFVIQNGKGSVSAALNTGMQKAAGEYLSAGCTAGIFPPIWKRRGRRRRIWCSAAWMRTRSS